MRLQIRQNSRWISFFQRSLDPVFARPEINHQAKQQHNHHGVDPRCVFQRPIGWKKIQRPRQQWRRRDPQQYQKSDIGQPAVNRKQQHQHFTQIPAPVPHQSADQKPQQQHQHNPAPQLVEVHRHPFRHVRDIELLPERQIKRIENQPPSKRIHKQRRHRCHASKNQPAELRRRPAHRLDPPPRPAHQPGDEDEKKQNQPQRPRAMRVRPQTKQQRNRPQRRISAHPEPLQDNQQNHQVQIAEKNRPRPE